MLRTAPSSILRALALAALLAPALASAQHREGRRRSVPEFDPAAAGAIAALLAGGAVLARRGRR